MSKSQYSDFASSLYDGDIDNLIFFTISNYLAIPDLSGSQQIFDRLDSEFFYPVIPLTALSLFTRVGSDRRKTFILYNNMAHNE